jgi:hypothetical protein
VNFFPALLMTALIFSISDSLGASITGKAGGTPEETDKPAWEYSLSTAVYVPLRSQDYANPIITADHDWLHIEARYNYEALKTGSLWIGYKFSFGEKLEIGLTPMLGGVFGNTTGIAPGYTISASYRPIEFFTQGEYLFDAGASSNNFFYTWSELSCAVTSWFKAGIVVDRTKTLGTSIDIRRGPLIGFNYKKVNFTTYWLSPGSRDATFIFAVTVNF